MEIAIMDLYDLIGNIRKRPTMYLGDISISNLRTFLAGYCFARRQLGIPQTLQEKEFSEFSSWIQKKFNMKSIQSWDQTILSVSTNDSQAMEEFFVLFYEFTQVRQHPEPLNQRSLLEYKAIVGK